jgi:allophanate hydrolase
MSAETFSFASPLPPGGVSFAGVRARLAGGASLVDLVTEWSAALRETEKLDPAIWITRFPDEMLRQRAEELEALGPEGRPLYGLPFAVKDNIDVRGLPTTAACPEFAYEPTANAAVVEKLLQAGAICLGKTNLDQFATGLVGVRSPYGVPVNVWRSDLIPGGSSAGSAAAVARGLVAFALGTDTAGSGRVPAALQGLVGLKPTVGRWSCRGVVPACKSLDCVSIFTREVEEAREILGVLSGFDAADSFSRRMELLPARGRRVVPVLGVPRAEQCEFFGDAAQEAAWNNTLRGLSAAGFSLREIDFAPFLETARLLYEGPWVAERVWAVGSLLTENPDCLWPATRQILQGGAGATAVDAFAAYYRLQELRRRAEGIWSEIDILLTPTMPTIYSVAEVEAEPLLLNSRLGTYTNFVNLLDLCGLALPCGLRSDGLPFGLTALAPAGEDERLLDFAASRNTHGAENQAMALAVCGAHMRGLPLHARLLELGAVFLREDTTAPRYRMVALDEKRPGLFQVANGGDSLPLEVYSLPCAGVGRLLAEIPAPLGLGSVHLQDGSVVTGFLCEAAAAAGCQDITGFGGWRSWLQAR